MMWKKLLLAWDGSTGATRAALVAMDLTHRFKAEFHALAVEPRVPCVMNTSRVLESRQEVAEFVRRTLADLRLLATAQGVSVHCHQRSGEEVENILHFIDLHGVDLLVMGRTGHSANFGHHWGTTSQELMRRAPCSVLVTK